MPPPPEEKKPEKEVKPEPLPAENKTEPEEE